MRFSIDRASLVRACNHLSGIYVGRTVVPITNNALLQAEREQLVITANNYAQSMSITIPAKVEEQGATTVEYHKLKSIADVSPEGSELSLIDDSENGRAEIRAGRSRYKLFTLPACDFPIFEFPDTAGRIVFRGAELERLLSVAYAAIDDRTRPFLNGVYLHRRADGFGAVATDGHRLAFAEVPAPETMEDIDELGVIIPSPAVKMLQGLLSDDAVRLDADKNKIAATFDRGSVIIRFASKLVEGTYPDFGRLIPPRTDRNFSIQTDPLGLAVKRAMIAKDDKTTAVALDLFDGGVTVSARNTTSGEAADEVGCSWEAGEFRIGFNGNYLLASLNGMAAKELEFHMPANANNALRIEVPGDAGRVDVIMPMRV